MFRITQFCYLEVRPGSHSAHIKPTMVLVLIRLLAIRALTSGFLALGQANDSPHARVNAKSRLSSRGVYAAGSQARLSVNVTSVYGHEAVVQVSWSGTAFGQPTDWIGMWPSDVNIDVFSSPMKFKYVGGGPNFECFRKLEESACNSEARCQWFRGRCTSAPPPSEGNITFQVWNKRTDVVFLYISGNIQYPELIARSEIVKIRDRDIPQGGHLALGSDPTQMRVYWQAGGMPSRPGVKYGTTCENLDKLVSGEANPMRQYKKEDMCDRQTQPAGRQGWLHPGSLLEATLTGLVPGQKYCYSYGDDATGWSYPKSFVSSPAVGPRWPTTIGAFGDLGQVETDQAYHHSWDFGNRGELPSVNTTVALASDSAIEIVLHIGDISYAVGYMAEWDNFFRQIYPVASKMPWMTAIGNHEFGWSNSFYAAEDSGGECGVPYNAYFPFASQDDKTEVRLSERRPWYAFKYGPATFVQMSTEHDFTKGSDQHRWLERTLRMVNRSETPWVIFSGHRPMYVPSDFKEDQLVSDDLKQHVEPLLLEYNVDVAFWAHFHAFSKTCKMRNGKCDDDGVGHFVIGMAGYDHSDCSKSKEVLSLMSCNDSLWGYVRLTFNSEASMTLELVDSATGKVVETHDVRGNSGRLSDVALGSGSSALLV
eukprot:TRINITY_DN25750_c0_g1_i1.p1 TRINITY_DN25750_c0_g1~~TRINITY_DN25750_c0_g1_i1.p1  ORF type:complete len:651 (+),score=59.57 TRINITY_DN25750_c0_g1_i1:15-1967(+)